MVGVERVYIGKLFVPSQQDKNLRLQNETDSQGTQEKILLHSRCNLITVEFTATWCRYMSEHLDDFKSHLKFMKEECSINNS